jgi:uridine nucleosidase
MAAAAPTPPPAAAADDRIPVWLDVDPGHDDVFAILLAGHHPRLRLLGLSAVHGNQAVVHTAANAARVAYAAGLGGVAVVAGAGAPLLRPPKYCPEVHGEDGLGGVVGLPPAGALPPPPAGPAVVPGPAAVGAMYAAIVAAATAPGGRPVTLVATGALTNVALLLATYRGAVTAHLAEIVLMGGAVGRGNTGPVSEFNIQVDPEAAAVVFASGVPLAMVPLDVTHTALVTPEVFAAMATGGSGAVSAAGAYPPEHAGPGGGEAERLLTAAGGGWPAVAAAQAAAQAAAASPFRAMVVSALAYFAASYRSTFAMAHPPLHDPLAVAWVADRGLFTARRAGVTVDTGAGPSAGQTVVDLYGVAGPGAVASVPSPGTRGAGTADSAAVGWAGGGWTADVALAVDVRAFWGVMLAAVAAADAVSPLNNKSSGGAA